MSVSLPVLRYDPRVDGALCDACPLGGQRHKIGLDDSKWIPVPAETKPNSRFLAVGAYVGRDEEMEGRPMVGKAGVELNNVFNALRVPRSQYSIDNVLACKPPGAENALEALYHKINVYNRELKKNALPGQTPEYLPDPAACCRPRLMRTALQHTNLFLLGPSAVTTFLGADTKAAEVRGGPVDAVMFQSGAVMSLDFEKETPPGVVHRWHVLPSLHVGFVARKKRWRRVFLVDAGRALRFYEGRLNWKKPIILRNRPIHEVADFFMSGRPAYWTDVETDWHPRKNCPGTGACSEGCAKQDPWEQETQCIGTGDSEVVFVTHFQSIDGETRFWTESEETKWQELYAWMLSNPRILKRGWNCLHGETPVRMADGTSKALWRIRPGESVLGVYHGRLVSARVVARPIQHVPGQRWLSIRLCGPEKRHGHGLVLTPDHRVRTDRGWKRADTLSRADNVWLPEARLSKAQCQAILGTVLGDSVLMRSSSRVEETVSTASLRGSHVSSRLRAAKVSLLPFLKSRPRELVRGYGKGFAYPYQSPMLRQLGGLRREVYDSQGKRRLRVSTLERLGPIGLAWWYMDDGNQRRRKGRATVEIATHGFPRKDVRAAAAWLSERFGRVVAEWHRSGYRLRFTVEATRKFILHVSRHVFPCVRYKLPKWVGGSEWKRILPSVARPLKERVKSVSRFRPKRGVNTRYCLTTETGNFFTSYGLVKNCGYFDRLHCLGRGKGAKVGVWMAPLVDDILPHRLYDCEIPHTLGFAASLEIDTPAWKADGAREHPKSDEDRGIYNGTDVGANGALGPILDKVVAERGQSHLVEWDHEVQEMCVGLTLNGLHVDQDRRRWWESKLNADEVKWETEFKLYAKEATTKLADLWQLDDNAKLPWYLEFIEKMNVGSPPQVAELFFDIWGLTPKDYSEKTGEPSTDDDTLIALYVSPETDGFPEMRRCVRALRFHRKVIKMRGTYVTPARPRNLGGLLSPDGRQRSTWNAHVARTGRLSSSDPNHQNVPGKDPYNLRSMYTAQPGHVLVFGDLDQVELRLAVAMAQAKAYIDLFNRNVDPHGKLCERAFSFYTNTLGYKRPEEGKPKKNSVADRLRDLVKRVQYGGLYLATVETLHNLIVSAEDGRGELIYANHEADQTRAIYKAWLEFAPEIPAWWSKTINDWQRFGYVIEPVLGRRFDCRDSLGATSVDDIDDINSLPNHLCQGGAAGLMAIICRRIRKRYPHNFAGPYTGMVLQTHDGVALEVPVEIALKVQADLQEDMTISLPQLSNVTFTAETAIAFRWADVYCPGCKGNIDTVMERFGEKVCPNGGRCEGAA